MLELEIGKHEEVGIEYQGYNLTEFTILKISEHSEAQIILEFLNSKYFLEDCRPDIVKKDIHKNEGFLRPAFITENLSIDDLKKLSKTQIVAFLNQFGATTDWGTSDGKDFEVLKDTFIDVINQNDTDNFYLINMDWFKNNLLKVHEFESWCYVYYFLFFWINDKKTNFTLCEWAYD